jgi:molybdate transport system substrate-binding protein
VSPTPAGPPINLTIAAAASLTKPMDEIIEAYKTAAPDVTITPTYGGSGALQTQIEEGAPIDIFFPAAAKQMDALETKGLIDTGTRIDMLKNEIVLIVPSSSALTLTRFEDVVSDTVSNIAVGDPKSVPAGQYAQEVFTYLKIWEEVTSKATLGADVKQVLSWVSTGNADCGIVYKTDAATDENVKIVATAPEASHASIIYPVAVVKSNKDQTAAKAFIEYLNSSGAMDIFKKYGFLAN